MRNTPDSKQSAGKCASWLQRLVGRLCIPSDITNKCTRHEIVSKKSQKRNMSDTPRTDAVKYHAKGQFQDVVAADFARTLERENIKLREKVKNQTNRIRFFEGATNHAGGIPKVWRDAPCPHCSGTGNAGAWLAPDSALPNV